MKTRIKWFRINKNFPKSDCKVFVILNNNEKLLEISYFFEDSFGKYFSSNWDVWDKKYTNFVTHWAYIPKNFVPEIIRREKND